MPTRTGMAPPFEPRYGDRPLWAAVYERLAKMKIGQVITDADLAALVPEGATWQGAFYRAVLEMEREHLRTFDRVRKTGYRMVEANEHERLARDQHRRARRRLKAAHRKAHSSDRSLLTHEERRRMDDLELHLARHADMIARLDHRVLTEVRERKADVAGVSERLDKLTEQLRRHGIVPEGEESNEDTGQATGR